MVGQNAPLRYVWIGREKYTRKVWIRLVEYSSSDVSGPSEGTLFVGKLILVIKEVFKYNRVLTRFTFVACVRFTKPSILSSKIDAR